MRTGVIEFVLEETGVDALEYGLLISLIFLAILFSVMLFATNTTALFTTIASNV